MAALRKRAERRPPHLPELVTVTLQLPAEVAEWLTEQPPGTLEHLLRERMAAAAAPPLVIAPELEPLLAQVDPGERARVAALARYPQLVEAVARGLVSVERAEAMAAEADSRR